jgi:hypothetical protein
VSNDETWIASVSTDLSAEPLPDGTISKPFFDLEDALNYGRYQSSQRNFTQINIHLWKGIHYLLYSPTWFYYLSASTINYALSITPLYCTYTDPGGLDITDI